MRDDHRAAVPARAVLLVVLLVLAAPRPAVADEPVWAVLKAGGQVVLIRHAITTPGVGDPPGMRLDDCGAQPNLTVVPLPGDRAARLRFRRDVGAARQPLRPS